MRPLSLLLLVLLLLQSVALQAQTRYYRYTNDSGVKVIDDTIPPEFVKNGYEVLSADGRVIETVDRELTEEERRLRNTEESRRRIAEEEKQRLLEWDESLLRRYSTVEDIDAAEQRAVRDLEIRISILQSNVISVKQQIENLQARAADAERRGLEVPASIQENIATLRLEMADTEESIAARNSEVDAVKASFQRDKDRFAKLREQAEARRLGREALRGNSN